MSVLAGCWDLRNMVGIHEIDCPRCGKKKASRFLTETI